jgi:hypothetical protein
MRVPRRMSLSRMSVGGDGAVLFVFGRDQQRDAAVGGDKCDVDQ